MDMASVQLMLRPPLTMAAGAMVATDMARDPLMLMPTTAGEDMVAMDTESALLIRHLTTAGVAMEATVMASVQLMPRLPLTMAGEAMEATDMASALPSQHLTTAGVAMEAMDTESKCFSKNSI